MRLLIYVLLALFVWAVLQSPSARNGGYKACISPSGNAWVACPKRD